MCIYVRQKNPRIGEATNPELRIGGGPILRYSLKMKNLDKMKMLKILTKLTLQICFQNLTVVAENDIKKYV